MREVICELLGISQTSYYRWKEDRAIISMLEKYFNEEDLKQYISEGKIDKLEQNKIQNSKMEDFFLNNILHKIIIKSTLPSNTEELKKKFFNPLVHVDVLNTVFPLQTFLNVLNDPNIINRQTLISKVNNSKNISSMKKEEIIKFLMNEASDLEFDALVVHKVKINEFFDKEKRNKNTMLNFEEPGRDYYSDIEDDDVVPVDEE